MSGALYEGIYASAIGIGHLVAPFSSKLRLGINGRVGLLGRIRAQVTTWDATSERFWFHVASSGEFEQLLPLLDAMRVRAPQAKLVVTYFSPTAKRAIELEKTRRASADLAVPWDLCEFSPYDVGTSVKPFLDLIRPKALVSIHREIWPGMLAECKKRGISTHLFAAFFPALPRPWWFFEGALSQFQTIRTTQVGTAELLQQHLPRASVTCFGDPRIDRVLARKASSRPLPPEIDRALARRPNAVFASIWPKEISLLQSQLISLIRESSDWRFVFVPHEPSKEFTAQLLRLFEKTGKKAMRWSEWKQSPQSDCGLIVDEVGHLAELYRVASWVYVGGSFRARVHNVLEPAAYGKPVLTGPFIWNSGEALEMEALGAGLIRAESPKEFEASARRYLTDVAFRESSSEKILQYLEDRQGSALRYAELLVPS